MAWSLLGTLHIWYGSLALLLLGLDFFISWCIIKKNCKSKVLIFISKIFPAFGFIGVLVQLYIWRKFDYIFDFMIGRANDDDCDKITIECQTLKDNSEKAQDDIEILMAINVFGFLLKCILEWVLINLEQNREAEETGPSTGLQNRNNRQTTNNSELQNIIIRGATNHAKPFGEISSTRIGLFGKLALECNKIVKNRYVWYNLFLLVVSFTVGIRTLMLVIWIAILCTSPFTVPLFFGWLSSFLRTRKVKVD